MYNKDNKNNIKWPIFLRQFWLKQNAKRIWIVAQYLASVWEGGTVGVGKNRPTGWARSRLHKHRTYIEHKILYWFLKFLVTNLTGNKSTHSHTHFFLNTTPDSREIIQNVVKNTWMSTNLQFRENCTPKKPNECLVSGQKTNYICTQ